MDSVWSRAWHGESLAQCAILITRKNWLRCVGTADTPLFKEGANAAGRSRQFRVLVQWNPLQQALKLMQPRAHRASESW